MSRRAAIAVLLIILANQVAFGVGMYWVGLQAGRADCGNLLVRP